ncbi:MAG: NAD(P)/FAD-dependent oxidoreductase [Chitinophagaceae bacterium]|nr:NAD(P)/FAD-dependent oxidoreductase [Chitinophagaceae bacterium]
MYVKDTHTLIIGASISGLATAACLHRKKIEYLIIEKQGRVAAPWHSHYDRLHLHTSKGSSHLPYKKFGKRIPRYPSREQVIDYLEDYQRTFDIHPIFNTEATTIRKTDGYWLTGTAGGQFRSKYLIMATGAYGKPRPIEFKGMETFPGRVLHSYEYRSGRDFKGQNVLLIGFGNSACEIAIDLYEQGSTPSMSVRSPVNVVPRDVLGIPVLRLSLLMNRLPPRIADVISAPLVKWLIGDISKLGLRKMPYGPLEQIRRDGKAPVLDIGTIRHIRDGCIKVYDDIDHIDGKTIYFIDGKKERFDAIVAGIGYYRDYAEIVKVAPCRFDDLRVSIDNQKYFGQDGLYFCGYWVSPTGQIREIASDAKKIAGDIARKEPGH